MEKQLQLYKIWAPDDALWTQWAKPVVFMNIVSPSSYRGSGLDNMTIGRINYASDTMVIVDLAGKKSLEAGLAFARNGYRPVPLYNGVPEPQRTAAAVAMEGIVHGLCGGAQMLRQMTLSKTANPVFLLDSRRLRVDKKTPGVFDNRWCVVPQDMPSANYLKKYGIKKVVVRADEMQDDLRCILYQYQENDILILCCSKSGEVSPKKLAKPHGKQWFYRFLLFMGLSRSATGGFGMEIPMITHEGSGYRHYRSG